MVKALRISSRCSNPPSCDRTNYMSDVIRRPAEVTVVVVLTYVSAIASIVLGVLLILARYGIPAEDNTARTIITIAGAIVVLIGYPDSCCGIWNQSRGSQRAPHCHRPAGDGHRSIARIPCSGPIQPLVDARRGGDRRRRSHRAVDRPGSSVLWAAHRRVTLRCTARTISIAPIDRAATTTINSAVSAPGSTSCRKFATSGIE